MVLIFAFFALFICAALNGSAKTNIKNIEIDYNYYHNMIQKAERDSDYKKVATITDWVYNDDCDKWYFTYEIETAFDSLDGYTYSVYSFEDMNRLVIGQEIMVAVNSKTVNMLTDSIPMEFANINPEQDGEYIKALSTKKTMTTLIIIFSIVSVGAIVVTIIYMVKTKKEEGAKELEQKEMAEEKHEMEKKILAQELDWQCSYCGGKNKKEDSKCSNCGAGRIK